MFYVLSWEENIKYMKNPFTESNLTVKKKFNWIFFTRNIFSKTTTVIIIMMCKKRIIINKFFIFFGRELRQTQDIIFRWRSGWYFTKSHTQKSTFLISLAWVERYFSLVLGAKSDKSMCVRKTKDRACSS